VRTGHTSPAARLLTAPADLRHKVDVGSRLGTRWSLSTSKPGHGVAALRDDDLERVWQ
jgi:hypothetical protein